MLDAGARTIHVDVMDGHFVPPISMGALVVDALAEQIHEAGALVDVHLMVERPERHIEEFAKAGADNITIHVEATPHVHYALQRSAAGCTAGLALCPATPVAAASELLGDLDLLLCMTVNPGWGGQEFLLSSLGKLERLRALLGPGVGDRGRRRDRRRDRGPVRGRGGDRLRGRIGGVRGRRSGQCVPRDRRCRPPRNGVGRLTD